MLLSTCFLIFILWFCCFTVLKDKKIKAEANQLRKSIRETEINLSRLTGIKSLSKNNSKENNQDICVRDDNELPKSKNNPAPPSVPPLISTTNFNNKSRGKTKKNEDTILYHPYDILDMSTRPLDTSKGNINEAFVSDYEYLNEENSSKEVASNPKRSSHSSRYIDLNAHSKPRKELTLNGRISKYSTLKNQPKLTRDQIEKEFFEYTLECRKRLNDIFLNSPSSDTFGGSSSSTTEHAETLVQTSTSPKRIVNNYNSLKIKVKRPTGSSVRRTKKTEQVWQI